MNIPPVGLFPRIAATALTSLFGATILAHAGGKVAVWGENYYGQLHLPNGLNNVKAIAAGSAHSLALKADGSVVGWGDNTYRQAIPPLGLLGVAAIAAGGSHSMALRADGTIVAWGNNFYGQTNVPAGLTGNVQAIAAGGGHGLALKTDGTVSAWGWGNYGQTNVPAGLSDVIAIAASTYHSLALKSDGTVAAWGYNLYGQTNVPSGLSGVIAIAASTFRSVALKADGTAVAWGAGYSGETNTPPNVSNIVAIAASRWDHDILALKSDGMVIAWGRITNLPSGLTNVIAVAAGDGHALAIVSDGPPEILDQPANTGVAFQSNVTLSVTARGFEPLSYRWSFNGYPLTDSARISGETNATLTISNAQFSDIGAYTVIASNALGIVQSTGALLTVISPPIITLQPVGRTVIAGTNITLTAAATGTPPLSYQWLLEGTPLIGATRTSLSFSNVQSSLNGNYSLRVTNVYGVTDSSNAVVTVLESPPYILAQPTNRTSFLGGTAIFSVNARGSTPLSYQWRFNGADIPGATNAMLTLTSLRYDQAGYYTVAISNTFGSVVSAKAQLCMNQVAVWGSGSFALAAITNVPTGLTNLVAIDAGETHLLALSQAGTVAAWGYALPQRARPPYPALNPATNVPANLNGVIAISAGASHNLALRSNGTVVAWGDNSYGQTNVPAGLTNVISVGAGDVHSLALKADGRLVAWGAHSSTEPPFFSFYGGLTNVPAGLSNVVAIAVGFDRNLALKSDGRVVCWGSPRAGTNVPATISNVIALACGEAGTIGRTSTTFNLALQADGTVASWPGSAYVDPGGPYPWIIPPTPPPGLSNVVAIAAGGHGMALKVDGSVVIWGFTNPPPPTGLSNVIGIAAGYGFAAAIAGDGSPRFTIQPVGQTVVRGNKIQFHAQATGIQPLRYQWQLDGVNLSGATNASLNLTNVQGHDAGAYRVVVSNALGTTTSRSATLTIPFSSDLAFALNATNLVWTTSSTNAPWFAQIHETHDGDVAAQSGYVLHGQQSILQTTVVGPGTLTFWWKVSSEEGYDRLWFNVDVMSSIHAISGEKDWQQVAMPIPTGAHVVRWVYSKDATVSAGRDAGWLDEVVFTPATPLMLTAPRLLPDGSLLFDASDPGGRTLLPANLALIEVQASTNLQDWVTLSGACVLTNGALVLRDPDGGNYPSRFYRIVEH